MGMEGKIDFPTSLKNRLALFKPNVDDVSQLVEFLKKNITPSIKRNEEFFRKYAKQIYIISGGFLEYIFPVVKSFGLSKNHILANRFLMGKNGTVAGFDKKNLLSHSLGKLKAVKKLGLKGNIYVIGDGITDYQIKEKGVADKFFAFTENVARKGVVAKADAVIKNIDELLHKFNLPRTQSFPKSKMKVLLLENISKQAEEAFIKEGYSVTSYKQSLSEKELLEIIEDISILGIRSKTEITKPVLQKAKKLLVIGAFCIGTNQIDLKEAVKSAVAVFNAPYSNTRSVVELVLGEIIMLYRKTFDKSKKMHKGIWDKSANGCFEVRGKKLGIIGYGNIGTQLSVLAENLGMQVYFYDVFEKLALGNAKKCSSLEELLVTCDVISVNVDGSKTNKNLIGKKEFELMRDNVIFLNLSRGHVVEVDSLVEAIKSGKISGAAIDVFPNEPKGNDDPFISPLIGLPNVILTPHVGGSTEEAQKNIGEFVSNKLVQFVNTGNTVISANFPTISIPQATAHRYIHVHKNIPGMLAKINETFANKNINILGQYLKTNEDIGYVITDTDKTYDKILAARLKEIPGTIRVRELY